MERHGLRVFLIADRLATAREIEVDREVLLIAGLLHDVGLYDEASHGGVYVKDERSSRPSCFASTTGATTGSRCASTRSSGTTSSGASGTAEPRSSRSAELTSSTCRWPDPLRPRPRVDPRPLQIGLQGRDLPDDRIPGGASPPSPATHTPADLQALAPQAAFAQCGPPAPAHGLGRDWNHASDPPAEKCDFRGLTFLPHVARLTPMKPVGGHAVKGIMCCSRWLLDG